MDDPKLITALQNTPGNFLERLNILEDQVQGLLVAESPQVEEITGGRVTVVDLLVSPAEGVRVNDPQSVEYTGSFIAGDGLEFDGDLYVMGNVVLGVLKTGFTDLGTLFATDAEIEGTIIIGTGSEAGGWFINSTSIFNDDISLDSSIPAILIGDATATMTGPGIFMGNDAGVYKMRIGDPGGNYLLWDGSNLSTVGQWIQSAGMNPALQEWQTNVVFSSASDFQVNWTSGTLRLSDGTTYSISAGNTGTMAALTHIYLDINVSNTVFQTTTTYSTATGDGKILVASAQNATAGASVLIFSGQQPIINGGAQITALSILAGNIAAGAITASKISVTSLSAITATMGSLTIDNKLTMSGASGAIAIGTTPPTSSVAGTGLWIDRTGVYSLDTSVQQATLTSDGLSAGAGAVVLNENGIVIEADEYPPTALLTFVSDDTATLIASVTPYYLVAGLQSGYISNGYAKDNTYEGLNYAFAWNHDSSFFSSLQIGSDGDARFDLKFGENTAKDSKALFISTQYADGNLAQNMLYLDLTTTGMASPGLGPAIALRAENTNGDLETIGYIVWDYVDPNDGEETSRVYLAVKEKGSIITTTLLAGTPYTVSLLHFDGADTSTTFTDSRGPVWTARGNAQLDTAQFVFGTASLLLDGTGDFIDSPDSPIWAWGTGDFTVDFRVRFNVLPTSGNVQSFFGNGLTSAAGGYQFFVRNTAGTYSIELQNYAAGSVLNINIIKNSPGLVINTWYHLAIVRSGTSFYTFQNGTQLGVTATDADSITDSTGLFYIGGGVGGGNVMNGWVDEFRVSKGIARWTANFTPPATAYV